MLLFLTRAAPVSYYRRVPATGGQVDKLHPEVGTTQHVQVEIDRVIDVLQELSDDCRKMATLGEVKESTPM